MSTFIVAKLIATPGLNTVEIYGPSSEVISGGFDSTGTLCIWAKTEKTGLRSTTHYVLVTRSGDDIPDELAVRMRHLSTAVRPYNGEEYHFFYLGREA